MKSHLIKNFEWYLAFLVLIIYYFTFGRSVVSLDNGELAATSYFLGIPHPPGYPLFTIIGYIVSHIPIPLRVIEKLNFLSSIYSAIAVFFLLKSLKLLVFEFESTKFSNTNFKALRNLNDFEKNFVVLTGGLIFAFSKTFWFQSTNYEVYSLNIVFISVIVYYSLKAFLHSMDFSKSTQFKNKYQLAVFITFGLILTNHTMGSLIIFPVLYLYFSSNYSKKIKILVQYLTLSLLIALIFYSYIWIRGSMGALAGFGLPQNLSETFEHITGKIYQQFFFSSLESFFKNLAFFFSSLNFHYNRFDFNSSEFNLNILFVIPGFVFLFFTAKKLFTFFIISLWIFIFVPSLYSIQDIDAYYIPAYFTLSFFITSGIYFLLRLTSKQLLKNLLVILLFILIVIQFVFNFNRVDQSKNFLEEDYFKSITQNLENKAKVINYSSWLHSMSLYFQLVEKHRADVIMLTYPLLSSKWYVNQINKIYGKGKELIINGINSANIQLKDNNNYFTIEMVTKVFNGEIKIPENFEFIPYGLVFKLVPKGTYVEQKNDMYNIRFGKQNFLTKDELENILKQMLILRIQYEIEFGKFNKAEELKKLFLSKFPISELPPNLN